jgi:hypothetical protein
VVVVGAQAALERSVVRDTEPLLGGGVGRGIQAQGHAPTLTRASVTLDRSLVERSHAAGVFASGADVTVTSALIRDTLAGPAGDGRSIHAQDDATLGASTLALQGARIDGSIVAGVFVGGSHASIESTVITGTLGGGDPGRELVVQYGPMAGVSPSVQVRHSLVESAGSLGVFAAGADVILDGTAVVAAAGNAPNRGVDVVAYPDAVVRSGVSLVASTVEGCGEMGVFASGADLWIDATAVRDSLPAMLGPGRGINVQAHGDGQRGSLVLQHSVIERSHQVGVGVIGSDSTMIASEIRDTYPPASGVARGVNVQSEPSTDARASATITSLLVERSHGIGIFAGASDAVADAVIVRDTLPTSDGSGGRGVVIQELCTPEGCDPTKRSVVSLTRTLVQRSREMGIYVGASDATITTSAVRETLSRDDGSFGDGIAVFASGGSASAAVYDTRIADSFRAAISSWGATVSLDSCLLSCQKHDINGEPLDGVAPHLDDLGGNLCGCPTADGNCYADAATLVPPAALDGL